jgi:membrane-associated phospholipid phosphatase
MIGMLFPKIKWATWTIAIVIGASRVCCGAHWPTDVVLGAFLGMVSADIVKALLLGRRKYAGSESNRP